MELADIPDLHVEQAGDEVTYRLPARPLGLLRLAGLFPLAFSVMWLGFVGSVLVPQFRHLTSQPQRFSYFICAFLVCFMAAGCAPAVVGLLILFGRSWIRWRDTHLTVLERVGPFGWPRRMPRGPIRKFIVTGGGPVEGGRTLPGPFATLAALSATFENGVSRTVVTGYPRPWLEAIAQDLSARTGLAQSTPPPPVEIYQGLTRELAAEATEKPAGSPVVLQRGSASITVDVPPPGFWKGSMGLPVFGTLWCLILAGITLAFAFGGQFDPTVLPVLAVFWLAGLVMLALAIHLGRRRVTFTAGHSGLTVVKSGPFGTRRLDFQRAAIADVSAGPSNWQVNHRPVPELQVRLATGKKIGFLAARDKDELRWIATELRNALGLAVAGPLPSPGLSGWAYARAGTWQPGTPLGKALSILIVVGIAITLLWRTLVGVVAPVHAHRPARPPATPAFLTNKPVAGDPTLVFNAFGPSGTYRATNTWAVGREAHAEWFVPTLSGRLSEILLAIEPDGSSASPGKATVFLARDKNGFPGRTLESFSVSADEKPGLLTLESTKAPALQAGVKYWLGARSRGGWVWHFNDQNVIHNTAREVRRGKWASAGDYCYVGAFSIRISTNQPPAELPQPAEDER
ncbi:MAG TPA: hypothetical protein VMU04_01565 [Candidatus Acidoferrum sp.]|nr:hypothetical protein [Candidatus Acidoferrum sp.]